MTRELFEQPQTTIGLCVTFDYAQVCTRLEWQEEGRPLTELVVTAEPDGLKWLLQHRGATEESHTLLLGSSIHAALRRLQKRFPVRAETIRFQRRLPDDSSSKRTRLEPLTGPGPLSWRILGMQLLDMGRALQINFSPLARIMDEADPDALRALGRDRRREEKQRDAQARLQARIAETQRQRAERDARRKQPSQPKPRKQSPMAPPARPLLPVPSVPVRVEPIEWRGQTELAGINGGLLTDPRPFFLLERASVWWVSNQSDDLLALPYCSIEHLDYQLRTALRVIGPLQGRALLSDEVGLGKTIEAGLVLKEYMMRGMVKRFLVVTLPSLVDQWQEELESKFNLPTVSTNQSAFRSNPAEFWRTHLCIVASLHTLKQDAHLAQAQQIGWDMLIVDEAHYLRNRASKAWQAVSVLPRQFLLLLTATPVHGSIEEIYNLVTLLKPGQLPTPREFRQRFLNPDRPTQPRDPDELRELLGQVMIRNTRSSAGIRLPPRRAETVLFEPTPAERQFWQTWESELREALGALTPSQASLWGRLLLQAAGSSPQAWQDALTSFPNRERAAHWRQSAPLQESWQKKLAPLPRLAAGDGGLVVFTQFLETQASLAEALRQAGVKTWVINGQTPPPQRQEITDRFRDEGGALLLTHSGTEGRNLQFSHRIVNFDLPWDPMEIEQRIGRLHRLGQQRPVEIYNLVQAGSLQEHLLEVLQDKLNLFELVVGETGLILGERFSSDDFAEEVFRRWRDSQGQVRQAMAALGEELQAARAEFDDVKRLDQVLFAGDYETG